MKLLHRKQFRNQTAVERKKILSKVLVEVKRMLAKRPPLSQHAQGSEQKEKSFLLFFGLTVGSETRHDSVKKSAGDGREGIGDPGADKRPLHLIRKCSTSRQQTFFLAPKNCLNLPAILSLLNI